MWAKNSTWLQLESVLLWNEIVCLNFTEIKCWAYSLFSRFIIIVGKENHWRANKGCSFIGGCGAGGENTIFQSEWPAAHKEGTTPPGPKIENPLVSSKSSVQVTSLSKWVSLRTVQHKVKQPNNMFLITLCLLGPIKPKCTYAPLCLSLFETSWAFLKCISTFLLILPFPYLISENTSILIISFLQLWPISWPKWDLAQEWNVGLTPKSQRNIPYY